MQKLSFTEFEKETNRNLTDLKKIINKLRLKKEGPWLGGGAILSSLNNEMPNDYDLFFNNYTQYTEYKKFLENNFDIKDRYQDVNLTYLVSIDKKRLLIADKRNIQVVGNKYFNTITDLVKYIDFTICRVATDGQDVWFDDQFIKDWKNKILTYGEEISPTQTSLYRIFKYSEKGYQINNGLFLKINSIIEKNKSFFIESGY